MNVSHIYDSHIYDGNGNHSQFCTCPGPVEPGPSTSSESPQTLGVTADLVPGTDEGGPGTIEADASNSFQNGNSSAPAAQGGATEERERRRVGMSYQVPDTFRDLLHAEKVFVWQSAIANQDNPLGPEMLDAHFARIEQAHEAEKAKAVNGVLDKLLEHGHGGGNWRRLIEQLRATGTGDEK